MLSFVLDIETVTLSQAQYSARPRSMRIDSKAQRVTNSMENGMPIEVTNMNGMPPLLYLRLKIELLVVLVEYGVLRTTLTVYV